MAGKNKDKDLEFVPMPSIVKKSSEKDELCSEWIATEKVHGSSFQFYTCDGRTIHMGSRTRCVDGTASFVRCDLKELLARHEEYVKAMFQEVCEKEKWLHYTRPIDPKDFEDTDDEVSDAASGEQPSLGGLDDAVENLEISQAETVELRIYGELYGGGGIEKGINSAVQKEIIYCDEFRFYVYSVTINRRWINMVELQELCTVAGFPFFATPVCSPRNALEELVGHLKNTGYMFEKSRLTEKSDNIKTMLEGVVMTPLRRPDYKSHAIKLLSESFNDVREEQANKGRARAGATQAKEVKHNYCTKARYLSVVSKLDIPERQDVERVQRLFVEDMEKESGETLNPNRRKGAEKAVYNWLKQDGHV